MSAGDYLERADNGEYVEFGELLENEPEEALEVFQNSRIERGSVVVDEDYALDKIYDDSEIDPWEIIEAPIRGALSSKYESGRGAGEKKAEEINRRHNNQANILDMLTEKTGTNSVKAKMADAGALAGLAGFSGSAAAGSVHGMGASATLGIVSSAKSSEYQGVRDSEQRAAVEGLEDAYGSKWLEIE
ncbi:MAG: hypothetical protein BRC29_00110 [Nanohaloarchaea archaeon SW_7_43_1]|nr:MAG: hypothetical protein BRC29_00110 [Nanohaloarchaea archaeon SW_7_43_1]